MQVVTGKIYAVFSKDRCRLHMIRPKKTPDFVEKPGVFLMLDYFSALCKSRSRVVPRSRNATVLLDTYRSERSRDGRDFR